jgi:hypothetical protein
MRFFCAVILMFGMALPARAQDKQGKWFSGNSVAVRTPTL